MFVQATLPLPHPRPADPWPPSTFPGPCRPARVQTLGSSDRDTESVRSSIDAEYVELRSRNLLERSRTFGAGWTLDPYRGCEWDDPFEAQRLAQSSAQRMDPRHQRTAETDRQGSRALIYVKSQAAAALRRQLEKGRFRGRFAGSGAALTIGAGADPYQPAEKHFRVTRSLLEVLLEVRGLNLAIETRSPLIARDLDLLAQLDRRHAVEITVGVAAMHPDLVRRLEPLAASPDRRLRTVAKLTRDGLSVRLRCSPLLPGINTSEEALRPLLAAARQAGARDVTADLLTMAPATRAWLFPWLERNFPEQVSRYRELYGWRDHLSPAQGRTTLAPLRKLRLEMGFPHSCVGRG